MKLVLANNTAEKFTSFYKELQDHSPGTFDYANYKSLLFFFDADASKTVRVVNLTAGKHLDEYDGVYIGGYLNTYELAAAVALSCDALEIPFVDKELRNAPSLSKLTEYAKLAAAGVSIPRTIAGTKSALLQAGGHIGDEIFPAVLKRADADRGRDNFKVVRREEISELLEGHDDRSLWILQEFVANDGYYRLGFYDDKAAFCIFRSLEDRLDGNTQKAHMYRPKGGANASLVEVVDIPTKIVEESLKAVRAMNRQIAGVDCLYDRHTGKVHILEVNYNPQLATIETFQDVRVQAFLDNLTRDWR